MPVQKSLAWLLLKERVVGVLQQHLQGEWEAWLTAVGADPGVFVLRAPAAEAYYLTDRLGLQLITNHPVSILVYDDDQRAQTLTRLSGTPAEDAETLEIPVAVEVLVAPLDGYQAQQRTGRPQTDFEAHIFVAEGFRGAIIDTITKHLPGGAGVEIVELLPSEGVETRTLGERGQYIRCALSWRVELSVSRPAPTYTP